MRHRHGLRKLNRTSSHRLAMLRLAVRGNPRLRVSDLELGRRSPSYTIDTVRMLAARWQQRPTLLLGGDALLDLPETRTAYEGLNVPANTCQASSDFAVRLSSM